MAQYTIYTDPSSGLRIRDGARNNEYVIDKELSISGFDASENVGWIYIGGAV